MFQNTYKLNGTSVCPVDGMIDYYVVEFYSNTIIMVEDIIKAVELLSKKTLLQEEYTELLANSVAGCAAVKTIGVHSNVTVESLYEKKVDEWGCKTPPPVVEVSRGESSGDCPETE